MPIPFPGSVYGGVKRLASKLQTNAESKGNVMKRSKNAIVKLRKGHLLSRIHCLHLAAILMLGLAVSGTALAGKGGKGGGGGGGGGSGNPTNIQYRATWFDNFLGGGFVIVRKMNNAGTMVGTVTTTAGEPRAFANVAGTSFDLNNTGATWFDMGSPITGWIATTAYGVNDQEQVVGEAFSISTQATRAYMLDLITNQFTLLPHTGAAGETNLAWDINELGVIVGTSYDGANETIVWTPWSGYAPLRLQCPTGFQVHINDAGVIVTDKGSVVFPNSTYNYTPGSFMSYPKKFYGINSAGLACGWQEEISQGNGKRRTILQAEGSFRFDTIAETEVTVKAGGSFAFDINDQDHVVSNYGGYLYTDQYGLLQLNQLVVNLGGDSVDFPYTLSDDYNGTGFGLIAGTSGGRFFLLTPEPKNP